MKWYFVGALCVCVIAMVLILENRPGFSSLGRSGKFEHVVPSPKDDPPGMWVQDVLITEQATAEQSKSWELFAKEISFYDAKRLALVKKLRAEFFPHEVEPWQLTAERGQINSSTGDMTVEGRVFLRPLWGYDLETAVLHWDAANRTLQTDGQVKISAETIEIVGTGFSGSVEQQRFTLQQQVRVSFH